MRAECFEMQVKYVYGYFTIYQPLQYIYLEDIGLPLPSFSPNKLTTPISLPPKSLFTWNGNIWFLLSIVLVSSWNKLKHAMHI